MIVIFQSKAAGDVIMFGDVALRMMEIMDKTPDPPEKPQGIVTVDQLPLAIEKLKAAIAADKAQRAGKQAEDEPQMELAEGGGRRPFVGLTQRAIPLLELLEWAQKKGHPVVWGV